MRINIKLEGKRQKAKVNFKASLLTFAFCLVTFALAAQQPQAPRTGKAAAVFDPTGYWVPLITEDWRFRMVTPPKGDYASMPLSVEGRRVADTWDLTKDDGAGNQCKAFGVGGVLRQPGRMQITWENDNTLKMDFDAGQQTRLLHFDKAQPPTEKTWQGYSVAEWDVPPAGGRGAPGNAVGAGGGGVAGGGGGGGGAGGGGAGGAAAAGGAAGGGGRGGRGGGGGGRAGGPPAIQRGALKITTTNMRDGYLRKNGVPYSENAVITEYVDRLGPEPDGAIYLLVRMSVDDPKYLNQPFVTSTHFRLEPDGSKRTPYPCKTDPPGLTK